MAVIRLVVEYDGTEFSGYQVQPGLRTVQGELEVAIKALTGEGVRIIAAGRTDAGVHAKGQVVSFSSASSLPPETFVKGLNFYLPADVSILEASYVPERFSARRSARSREYKYVVINRKSPSPLWRKRAYHYAHTLDLEAMVESAAILLGEHDYGAFAGSAGKPKGNTVRTIIRAELVKEGERIDFHVRANAFLPYQVRNIVGTLLWVGNGKLSIDDFRCVLDSKDRRKAGPTAPAHGLYLMKVYYD